MNAVILKDYTWICWIMFFFFMSLKTEPRANTYQIVQAGYGNCST